MTASYSQILPGSDATPFTVAQFIVDATLSGVQTVSVARVAAVDSVKLTVDVQVLVNLVTANGQSIPHGVIAGRPYFRAQGGTSGIILDPVVGDIGIVIFGSRDLSGVIAAKGLANPGSARSFDWADGIYFGGILNAAPTQYLKFLAGGITLLSPTAINIQSPSNTVTGPLAVTGATHLEGTLQVDGAADFESPVDFDAPITGTSAVFSGSVTASSFIGGGGGGGGTVTSVGISTPGSGVVVGGGPITTAGTLTVDLSSTAYAALSLAVTALQPLLTTKGDLYGYSTAPARVSVGSNGQVLTADSTAATGVSWQAPAGAIGSGALLTTSVDVTIPNNTQTAVPWDTAVFDTGSYYSGGSPTRLTAPATGVYIVNANIGWNGAPGGLRFIVFAVNANLSNRIAMNRNDSPPSNTYFQNIGTAIHLTAGDYVEVYVFQTSGGPTVGPFTQQTECTFSIARIA